MPRLTNCLYPTLVHMPFFFHCPQLSYIESNLISTEACVLMVGQHFSLGHNRYSIWGLK